MAATGYTPISLYYSTTASAVPTAGNLANGELALNIADMKLYAKNSSGVVTLLASNASTTGVDSLSFGSTGLTPSTATTGAITVAGTLNVANGGTGLTSLTAGRIPFGAGTSAFGNSANLFWDSGNNRLGIGTSSPQAKLHVYGSAALFDGLTGTSGSSGYGIHLTNSSSASYKWQLGMDSATSSLQFYDSGGYGIVMTLTRPGNLGLGVTPSAWSGFTGLQVGALGGLNLGGAVDDNFVGSNVYYNSNWYFARPTTATYASMYRQTSGQHRFYTSNATGTAGNAITWLQAMTLDASGNFMVGTTTPIGRVTVVGGGVHAQTAVATGSPDSYADGAGLMLSYNGGIGNIRAYSNTAGTGSTSITFTTTGAEAARISSTGGFSVGTTADPGAGAIYATGAITAYYSDDRLKTRLGLIENALDKVDQLQGFYYEANETAQALGYKVKREVGVSAQSVQAVLPEIVSPAPIDQQYLTVDYERLVPLLIEAVKELRAEVKALKGTI